MQSIHVSRYSNPMATGWAGYIQPDDRSWIAFIGLDGAPRFFLHRHASGAVLSDDSAERAEEIRMLEASAALADGFPGGPSMKPPVSQ